MCVLWWLFFPFIKHFWKKSLYFLHIFHDWVSVLFPSRAVLRFYNNLKKMSGDMPDWVHTVVCCKSDARNAMEMYFRLLDLYGYSLSCVTKLKSAYLCKSRHSVTFTNEPCCSCIWKGIFPLLPSSFYWHIKPVRSHGSTRIIFLKEGCCAAISCQSLQCIAYCNCSKVCQ